MRWDSDEDWVYIEKIGLESYTIEAATGGSSWFRVLFAAELKIKLYGDSSLLSVPQIDDDSLNSYSLLQNYPNPFNSITNINFQIPTRQIIKLKIYDILGNQIAELVDGEMDSGEHKIRFNSGDLSSGVYIYQLQTKNNILSKKMIFLK